MPKFIDYSGKKIGRVNVISLHEKRSGNNRWNCKCDCGHIFICWNASFRRGAKFECKPCWYERRRGIDLTGRQFGRWTVLKRHIGEDNKTYWHCRCDCGKEGYVGTYALGRKGKSESCGCLGRKRKSKHVNTTLYPPAHGLSTSKFYRTKTSLIHKCYRSTHASYHLFGGKGITVCDLWRNGTKDMYEWAIEKGWQEGDVFFLRSGESEFNPQTTEILKENDFRSYIGQKGGIQITYKGESHSILKWSKILSVDPGSLKRKLQNNPSVDVVFESEFKRQKFVRNPKLLEKCINMYKSGKRIEEIAKHIKVTPATILYQFRNNNITLRPIIKRNDIENDKIIELQNKGLSLNQIAIELNTSWTTVRNRIKKMNGEKRDRSKG